MTSAVDKRLEGLTCASLVDAMGRVHEHRADVVGLVSPAPDRMFGPAITIAYMPYRADLSRPDFAELYYQATDASPAGTVLVLSSGGYPDASHGGGTKLSRLAHHDAAGVLADGRLRDFEELKDRHVVAYCRGEATRAGGDTIMPFAANLPVEVGGVCVVPGDYVFADASGAVVIPRASLDEVLNKAVEVEAEDARSAEEIASENPSSFRDGLTGR